MLFFYGLALGGRDALYQGNKVECFAGGQYIGGVMLKTIVYGAVVGADQQLGGGLPGLGELLYPLGQVLQLQRGLCQELLAVGILVFARLQHHGQQPDTQRQHDAA